ncbi:hypothetical protein BG004_003872 [Podila humilis]|nr:hypothetical protein BG004_003872 [Podila humilis]
MLAMPFIWRTINIQTPQEYYKFMALDVQATLLRNAHHIHRIRTSYLQVLKCVVKPVVNNDAPGDLRSILFNGMPQDNKPFSQLHSICQNLRELHLDDFFPLVTPAKESYTNSGVQDQDPATQEVVTCLIKQNPHLKYLSFSPSFSDPAKVLSTLSATNLPGLESLTLSRPYKNWQKQESVTVSRDVAKRLFENLSGSIRTLYIELNIFENKNLQKEQHSNDQGLQQQQQQSVTTTTKHTQPHPNLRSLIMHGSMESGRGTEEYVLFQFLQSCSKPTLETVILPDCAELTVASLHGILKEHLEIQFNMVNFHESVLDMSNMMAHVSDRGVAQLIQRSSVWKSINLSNQSHVAALTSATIANRCEELEELTLYNMGKRNITSAAVQSILCRASKLKSLRANIATERYEQQQPHLRALHITQAPWACLSLRVLQINIAKVPRPDIRVLQDGKPARGVLSVGSENDSHILQRRVLAQIGELTSLEELRLGTYSIDRADSGWDFDGETEAETYADKTFQNYCLEMSLSCGLYLLKDLKFLRVLDVSKMAHRIGVPELEWIQANWPSLERLDGLFFEWYDILEPGVKDWLEEHQSKWGQAYFSPGYSFNGSGTRGGRNL